MIATFDKFNTRRRVRKLHSVGHIDIDADDAQHEFFAPGVEPVAFVESVAGQQQAAPND